MGIKKLLTVAALLAAGGLTHSAWAQTDVTSTYLTNADFETLPIDFTVANNGNVSGESTRIGSTGWVYTIPGWTNASVIGNNAVQIATAEYGLSTATTSGLNSTTPPAADNQGNTGAALHMSAGWGDDAIVTQVSKQQLLSGVYTFTYNVYNQNSSNNGVAANFTGVTLENGSSYAGTLNTATYGEWVSESITFTVPSTQNVTFKLGFTTSSGKSGEGAKLYVDNIKLSYKAFDEVTEDAPVDFTSMADNTVAGWTFNESNRDRKITAFDGQDMVQCYSDNYYTGDAMTQIISGLPTGIYDVEVYCQAQLANWNNHALVAEDGATDITFLKVNDQSQGVPVYQDKNARTKTLYTLNDVKVTDGNLTVKVTNEKEGANWILANIKTIKYLGADLSLLEESWTTNVASAEAVLADETYNIVTGEERTILAAKAAVTPVETVKGYNDAIGELTTALNAFKVAKTNYEALVSAKESASVYTTTAYPYASEAKKTALDNAVAAVATSAADADAKVAAIVTAYRQFVESNGKAEGVDGAVDYTSSIKGTDASVSTEGWSGFGTKQNEPYTDGNGEPATKYFDGGWSADAGLNINLTQNVTLPAGKYLIQITARGATALDVYT